MTYTGHGHHIPGTIPTTPLPGKKARCGGVRGCSQCNDDAVRALGHAPIDAIEITIKNVPIRYNGTIIGSVDINSDGKLDIYVNGGASKEFMDTIPFWMVNGFSLYPNTTSPVE